MAQPIPPDQYDIVVALIRCFPDGIAVGELRSHLKPIPEAAELAHCLQHLARKRRIEVIAGTAGAPNARYRAIPDQPGARPAPGSLPGDVDSERNPVPPVTLPPVPPAPEPPADPVSPPAPPPADVAAIAGPAAGAAPVFDDVVREVVRDVVLSLSPQPSAVALAQTQAAILHWNATLTAALLVRVEQELSRVTPETASEFGVVPEQVRAWRAVYDPDGVPPGPVPAPAPKEVPTKPEPEPLPPASKATPPPQPAARAPARPKSEPATDRTVLRHEMLGGDTASVPAGRSWAPSSGSKQDLPASLANALGTGLAGALSRALGDKFGAKERLVLGGVIAAILLSVYQPLLSSRWVALGLPVIGLVAYVGYVVRRRTGSTSGVTGPVRAASLRSGLTRYRWLLGVGCVLALGAVAGWIAYQRVVLRPPKAVISDYLTRSVAPLPVRVVGLEPAYGRPSAVGCPVTYQALFESTEPLYQGVDAIAYLREHAAGELATIEAANALLRGPDAARILAALGDRAPGLADALSWGRDDRVAASADATGASRPQASPSPLAAAAAAASPSFPPVLVSTRTPPGAVATAGGTLVAWRQDGAWRFSGSPVTLDRRALVGEPKPAGALAIDVPADVARLTAWVAAQVAYATKVQAAAVALAADLERTRQQQTGAFAQLLAPGTLFTGTIIDPIRATPQRVIVEIIAGTNQQLAAVLRNDGGWTDARPFTGQWTLAPAGDAAVVTLRTGRSDYIEGAGPLLQDRNDFAITLQVRADGAVTSMPGNTRLQRVAPANAGVIRDDVVRALAAAISATAAGRVYRGTARPRPNGPTESLLLRFLGGPEPGREPGSAPSAAALDAPLVLNASLESATVAGRVRAFRGTIISNTYRVGDAPIRLRSEDRARVAGVDNRSPLGLDTTNNLLVIALRPDGVRLTGQDDWFTYEFTPAEPGASAPPSGANPGPSGPGPAGGTGAANPPYPPLPPANAPPAGAGRALPPYPTSPGAYLLSGGHWMILPRNDGRVLEVSLPGSSGVGELAFLDTEPVPGVPAGEVCLIYVGRLPPLAAATLKQYPHLKTDPRFEVVPLQLESGVVRHTPVAELARDFTGFGPLKVAVTVEQPADDVIQVRGSLRAGRYALAMGRQYFELAVE